MHRQDGLCRETFFITNTGFEWIKLLPRKILQITHFFHFQLADHFQQFMAATTTSSAFVVYLQVCYMSLNHLLINYVPPHERPAEFTIQNAATKEQLTLRNAEIETKANDGIFYYYVEVLRHPIGAEAKMREWVKEWAYYELLWNQRGMKQVVRIFLPTIGYFKYVE